MLQTFNLQKKVYDFYAVEWYARCLILSRANYSILLKCIRVDIIDFVDK